MDGAVQQPAVADASSLQDSECEFEDTLINVFPTATKAKQLGPPSFLGLVFFPLTSGYCTRLSSLRSAACRIRMSEASEDGGKDAQGNNLYAALARTFTRSAALYFSRPVRLFRPSKSMLH